MADHIPEQNPFEPDRAKDPAHMELTAQQAALATYVEGVIDWCDDVQDLLPPLVSFRHNEHGPTEVDLNLADATGRKSLGWVALYKNPNVEKPADQPWLAISTTVPSDFQQNGVYKRALFFMGNGRVVWEENRALRVVRNGVTGDIDIKPSVSRAADPGDIAHCSTHLDFALSKCGVPTPKRFA